MKTWLKTLLIRIIKTSAEVALASIGTATMFQQIDWAVIGSTVALSAVATFLFNLTLIKEPEEGDE